MIEMVSSAALPRVSENIVEEWRSIHGSEDLYSVSSLGRVRSEPVNSSKVGKQRGRILRCYRDTKGYRQFGMTMLDGRVIRMKVHRAVALAFLGPRPPGHQINHRSGDKQDNCVANLEYVTCQQNIQHGWRTGLYNADHSRGERSATSKLTADAVRQIRSLYGAMSVGNLSRRFGVTAANIHCIVTGKTWKHVS